MLSRRSALIAGLAAPLPLLPQTTTERTPAVASALVKDFVIAGHNDLEKVQTMLAARPALLNATWDWVEATSKPHSAALLIWAGATLPYS